MVAQAKYKDEYCQIATKVLAEGESLAAICAELGVSRTTLYEWRDNNPSFRDAIETGLQMAQRVWEQIGKDGITGQYEKFNGAPWIFTMKNRFRADYAEDKEAKTATDVVLDKLLDRLVD